MPMYEYACRKCSKRFESLVFGKEKPACPKCGSADLEKLLSTFAVGAGGASSFGGDFGGDAGGDGFDAPGPGGACGSCGDPRGPGSCAMN